MSAPPTPVDRVLTDSGDAKKVPVRILVVQPERHPLVDATDEPMVMTVPHLLVREMIALISISLVLVVVSLLFDAPLEEIANPERTPNPAKAPWYFLGLQELLHYYPPFVAGVLIPGVVITALVVVPYFEVNLERRPLWASPRTVLGGGVLVLVLSLILGFGGAHPMWPAMVPLWMVAFVACVPRLLPGSTWVKVHLGHRSLSFWIFSWFLLVAATLTIIGIAFRGPGWSLVLPWRDGLYY